MDKEDLPETSREDRSARDMLWDVAWPLDLRWHWRLRLWSKSRRRQLAAEYVKLRQDQKNWDVTWVGRFSDERADLIISLSPPR
jgi:hypothetical protein